MAKPHSSSWATFTQLTEAFKMALHAIVANRMRSALTMLGIVIGIASVVSIVTLSQAAQKSMLKSLRNASGNGFVVSRGIKGDEHSANIHTLMPADMESISALPDIENVKPSISTNAKLRRLRFDISASIDGTGANASQQFGLPLISGRDLNEDDIRTHAQVVVINYIVRDKLFEANENPLGQTILLGNLPCVVIGVTGKATGLLSMFTFNAHVLIPYTTASSHLMGRLYLDGISVQVRDGWSIDDVQAHVQQLLKQRHGKKDFHINNSGDSFLQTVNQVVLVATLVISLIAAISLVVGGVGIMNIMLVTVTERTREIGIRMAVGARQRDVQNQFLIEAVTLCLVGGLIAVAITFIFSMIVNLATDVLSMEISLISIIVAFVVSTLLGAIFGFLPARNAARLDPIEALARD